MTEFNAEQADAVLENVAQHVAELAEAFQVAFDREVEVSGPDAAESFRLDIFEPGLASLFLQARLASGETIAAAIPALHGLLPDWVYEEQPDHAKLDALAKSIFTPLMPDTFELESFQANFCHDLSRLASHFETAQSLILLKLTIPDDEPKSWSMPIVWPLAQMIAPDDLIVDEEEDEPTTDDRQTAPPQEAAPASPAATAKKVESFGDLPPYSRSILKISVPVRVTLAQTKLPVSQVQDLGPGSIIEFKKSCGDPLSLEVGDQHIAEGEAVRVGEKFGLWITSMSLPDERFFKVIPNRVG